MQYVDGFIVAGAEEKPQSLSSAWRRKAGKVWTEHGAIEYHECVADDVKVGKWTSFPRSVKLKQGETVMFSWITYKSRKHRDSVIRR